MISGALGAVLFGIQSYSVIFLMGAAFSIAMGLYFFSKHPFTRVSYTFLALMLFIFLASVLSFVLVNVPDEGVAALTARLLVAAILLAYSGIFLLYSMMAYQEQIGRISEHLLPYALVSLVVARSPPTSSRCRKGHGAGGYRCPCLWACCMLS